MVDGLFLVNSALNVKQLSVFNVEHRFEQTLKTIQSIKNFCSSNKIIIFDSSPELVGDNYINRIISTGADFLYTGNNANINQFSKSGRRSLSECLSFIVTLEYLKNNYVECRRIYKISGRYELNEKFILTNDSYKDSFVFLTPLDSWMSKENQQFSDVDKLYRLRLWHMDSSLLDTFQSKLPSIFNNCLEYDIDVEHSYYKNLKMYKTISVEQIGVQGIIAPTGEIIYE